MCMSIASNQSHAHLNLKAILKKSLLEQTPTVAHNAPGHLVEKSTFDRHFRSHSGQNPYSCSEFLNLVDTAATLNICTY
jgi:hypothetical protein